MFRPAGRFLISPLPPGRLAARLLAAVILPPLLIFAIFKSPPYLLLLADKKIKHHADYRQNKYQNNPQCLFARVHGTSQGVKNGNNV
jgi:hypothetical protein